MSPNSGPFETGDVLKCTSDGYPVEYQWTDSKGAVVPGGSSVTIFEPGDFTLTCTASGNFTTPCNLSESVTGTATGTKQYSSKLITRRSDGGWVPRFSVASTLTQITQKNLKKIDRVLSFI